MAYCFMFLDEDGRLRWIGDVECASDVTAVVTAAKSLRARSGAAVVEITNDRRLVSRLTRGDVGDRPTPG